MLARALAATIVLWLGACGGDGGSRSESALKRGLEAVQDCRVRSVLSLHSGALLLELKGGGRIELSTDDEDEIHAAIERARPRCGSVEIAIE